VYSYYPILTLKFVNDFEVFLYVGYCPLVLTILTQNISNQFTYTHLFRSTFHQRPTFQLFMFSLLIYFFNFFPSYFISNFKFHISFTLLLFFSFSHYVFHFILSSHLQHYILLTGVYFFLTATRKRTAGK
jgi:hypothetical protein